MIHFFYILRIRTKVKSDIVASTFTFGTDYTIQKIDSQVSQILA